MVLRKEGYKDMDKFLKTRNEQRKRYYQKTQGYERRLWSDGEIEMILNSPKTDVELSDLLQRSVQAIQVKRTKVKNNLQKGGII